MSENFSEWWGRAPPYKIRRKMTIADIAKEFYFERPKGVLYHYTSLDGMDGIVKTKSLWATDLRYFNDAAEMRHTAELVRSEIARRIEQEGSNQRLLEQFREWLFNRLTDGHMVFVVSFTANGNLLSQWRGYCPHGRGVSLGFHPEKIAKCAENQLFKIARCIYDVALQQQLITRVVDAVESLGRDRGENADASKRHPSNSYYDLFEEIEGGLLSIAALLKHSSFKEEQEWRTVFPITKNYAEVPYTYRVGQSMLVPYIEFSLVQGANDPLEFQHVYLGPTPNINLSHSSLSRYLAKKNVGYKDGISYCEIPYRE